MLAVNFLSPAHGHWCSIPELANLTPGEQKQIAIPHPLRGYVFLANSKSLNIYDKYWDLLDTPISL